MFPVMQYIIICIFWDDKGGRDAHRPLTLYTSHLWSPLWIILSMYLWKLRYSNHELLLRWLTSFLLWYKRNFAVQFLRNSKSKQTSTSVTSARLPVSKNLFLCFSPVKMDIYGGPIHIIPWGDLLWKQKQSCGMDIVAFANASTFNSKFSSDRITPN